MSQQIVQTLSIQRQMVLPRMQVRARGIFSRRARIFFPPALLFCALLAQIAVKVELIERGYELEKLRERAIKNDSAVRKLRFDLAIASRPADLDIAAKSRLGMSGVNPGQVRAIVGGRKDV